jgi:hypothetical protein
MILRGLAAGIVSLVPAGALAADLACTFPLDRPRGSLTWEGGGPAEFRIDDRSAPAPLSCAMPVAASRFIDDAAFPRYVFEFDAADCADGPSRQKHAVSARVTLIVYPAHGNRGTLFWSREKVMDECATVALGPAAMKRAREAAR